MSTLAIAIRHALAPVVPAGALFLPLWYVETLLAKGAMHRYIKRVPLPGKFTKTGRQRYRYFYHVGHGGGVHARDHMVEGASFKHSGGHWHIGKTDGDKLTVRHDETGEEKTLTRAELGAMLEAEHGAGIASYHAKLRADYAEALANNASPKQLAALEKRGERAGIALTRPKPKKTPKEKPDAKRSPRKPKPRDDGGDGLLDLDGSRAGGSRPDDEDPGRDTRREGKEQADAELTADLGTVSPYVTEPPATDWKPPEKAALMLHEELAPAITVQLPEHVKTFPHPTGKAKGLFGHQIEGAERILTALKTGDGVVISDDAGTGKTNTAMATAVGLGAKRNLIVVPTAGKAGIKKQWRDTAKLYGITVKDGPPKSADEEGYFLVSYDELDGGTAYTLKDIEGWGAELGAAMGDYRAQLAEIRQSGKPWREQEARENEALTALRAKESEIRGRAQDVGARADLDGYLSDRKWKFKAKPTLAAGLKDGFGFVMFDESHNMANAESQRAKLAVELQDHVDKALYMSATPFTNISDMHYLTKLGEFNDRESFLEWAKKSGAKVNGNVVENPSSALPLTAISATLHVDGKMIKRVANLTGMSSAFVALDGKNGRPNPGAAPDAVDTFRLKDEIMDIASNAGILGKSLIGAFNTAWARQYWETLKVDEAIEAGKKALAAGKQVAFFTSYKGADHAHLRALADIARRKAERKAATGDNMAAMELGRAADQIDAIIDGMPKVEPAIARLVKAFGGPKVVAEIHGDTNKKPEVEQEEYQSGRKKVVVATMARGGTGISLHDDAGNAARVQINLSLPWSGREFNQVAGRSHRLGSKSATVMHWLVGDDPTERHNAAMVAKRLKTLNGLTTGDTEFQADARHLANFEFGSALSPDASAKELADAAMAAESGDSDERSSEALAARDYFHEYATARKAGRDVIGEESARRAAEREKKTHSAARTAIAKIATKHPEALEATRYSNGNYGLPAHLKAVAERIANKVPGRVAQDRSGRSHWFVPAEKLPEIAEKMGLHRAEHDREHVKALIQRHARFEPELAPKEAAPPEPPQSAETTSPATPEAERDRVLKRKGLNVSRYASAAHITGNTYEHKETIKDAAIRAGGRAKWDNGGWVVPHAAIEHLAKRFGKGSRLAHAIREALTKAAFVKPPGSGWQAIPNSKSGGYRRQHGSSWEYWYPSAHHALADHVFAGKLATTGRWEHRNSGDVQSAAAHYLQHSHGLDAGKVKQLAATSNVAVSNDGKRLTGITSQHGQQWRTVHALGERHAHHVGNVRGDISGDALHEKVAAAQAARGTKGWKDPGAVNLKAHVEGGSAAPAAAVNALLTHAKQTDNTALAEAMRAAMVAMQGAQAQQPAQATQQAPAQLPAAGQPTAPQAAPKAQQTAPAAGPKVAAAYAEHTKRHAKTAADHRVQAAQATKAGQHGLAAAHDAAAKAHDVARQRFAEAELDTGAVEDAHAQARAADRASDKAGQTPGNAPGPKFGSSGGATPAQRETARSAAVDAAKERQKATDAAEVARMQRQAPRAVHRAYEPTPEGLAANASAEVHDDAADAHEKARDRHWDLAKKASDKATADRHNAAGDEHDKAAHLHLQASRAGGHGGDEARAQSERAAAASERAKSTRTA